MEEIRGSIITSVNISKIEKDMKKIREVFQNMSKFRRIFQLQINMQKYTSGHIVTDSKKINNGSILKY